MPDKVNALSGPPMPAPLPPTKGAFSEYAFGGLAAFTVGFGRCPDRLLCRGLRTLCCRSNRR